jgi:hypothetical protein
MMGRVELPELSEVAGSVEVTSTTDISDFCDFFDDAKSNGDIQGEMNCTSNNDDALEGESGGESSRGGGDDDDSEDEDDAAGIIHANMGMLAIAVVFGVAQLL